LRWRSPPHRRDRIDVPVITDAGATDGGGTACLAMVLAYHGHPAPLEMCSGIALSVAPR
jgi:hypothetical protein